MTRECVCKCGRNYTQRMVSRAFVEKSLKPFGSALAIFRGLSPYGYLPLNCIPCERKALWSDHKREDYSI